MMIAALIGIMISIVVGVSLIPKITETIDAIPEEDVPEGFGVLVDILPIVFVAVILLGAVAWIGGSMGGGDTSTGRAWWSNRQKERKSPESRDLLHRTYSLSAHEEEHPDESTSLVDRKIQEADIVGEEVQTEKTSWRTRRSK